MSLFVYICNQLLRKTTIVFLFQYCGSYCIMIVLLYNVTIFHGLIPNNNTKYLFAGTFFADENYFSSHPIQKTGK